MTRSAAVLLRMPPTNYCRHERCPKVELHEAHDEDFVGAKARGRLAKKKTTSRPVIPDRPTVLHVEQRADGPFAFVACPECNGGKCGFCQETGRISLYRWHLWRRECS